jgi:alcohol dehydrogenase (cytochrome c)
VAPSLDTKTGLLYVPVGNPAPDFFGGERMGKNLYTAAMIVLDAKTGKLQWSGNSSRTISMTGT